MRSRFKLGIRTIGIELWRLLIPSPRTWSGILFIQAEIWDIASIGIFFTRLSEIPDQVRDDEAIIPNNHEFVGLGHFSVGDRGVMFRAKLTCH